MDDIHLYLLRCADGSYYVGLTRRPVAERFSEHVSGLVPGYTSHRRPVHLVYAESFQRLTDAIAAERQIKKWSRAKKEALIRGDFAALKALAKRKGAPRDAPYRALPSSSSGQGSPHERGFRFSGS